jgi:hypothetical protein
MIERAFYYSDTARNNPETVLDNSHRAIAKPYFLPGLAIETKGLPYEPVTMKRSRHIILLTK